MTNPAKYLSVILFALCVVGWVACTQQRDPCYTPESASLIIDMQHLVTDTSTVFVDTALPAAVFEPLSNTAQNQLTVYPQQANFTISLSPDSTVCQWAFTTDTVGTLIDTLTFYYQRKLQFISNACGYTYFYNIDSVHFTHYKNIDSIHILNPAVTNNVNTTTMQICIHPHF